MPPPRAAVPQTAVAQAFVLRAALPQGSYARDGRSADSCYARPLTRRETRLCRMALTDRITNAMASMTRAMDVAAV